MDHDPARPEEAPVELTAEQPDDQVDDSDSIALRLAPPVLTLVSGGPAQEAVITLTNPTQDAPGEQYIFEVDDDDLNARWYRLIPPSVYMQRGDTAQVRIRFEVPRKGTVPDEYPYRVSAYAQSNPAIATETTGRLLITSPPALLMTLTPETATGLTARYTVDLLSGPSDQVVDLVGQDPAEALAFTATPPRLRLGPNEPGQATLDVSIKPDVVGEARAYPFTVLADLSAGDEGLLPVECPATFVHVPEVTLGMQVAQARLDGRVATYTVTLINPTSLLLGVDLEAFDPRNALDIFFSGESPDDLRLGREQTLTLKALVRVDEDVPAGESRTYPFTIRARAHNTEGEGAFERAVECELVYQSQEGPAVAAPPQLDLAAQMRLALTPEQVAGTPARFTVQLENQGDMGVLLVLEGQDGQTALDYDFAPPQVYVGPGRSADAALTVTLRPAAPGFDAAESRSYPFAVSAWAPVAGPEQRLSGQGVLVRPYMPAADSIFQAILTPITPSGPEGSYDVRLINGSGVPLRVVVRARDPRGLLTFTSTARPVALAPATEQSVRLLVRPNALEPLSEEHTYPFEVICWLPGTDKMHALHGELRYVSF